MNLNFRFIIIKLIYINFHALKSLKNFFRDSYILNELHMKNYVVINAKKKKI